MYYVYINIFTVESVKINWFNSELSSNLGNTTE